MTDLEQIAESNRQARERCGKCGEERQSHAFVMGVHGGLWICPSVLFIPVAAVSTPAAQAEE